MEYIKNISKKAEKFIKKQDKVQRQRIYEAIQKLPNGDVKKLQNHAEMYRLRVGSYRVIYHFVENEIIIDVTDADNRGDVYKSY